MADDPASASSTPISGLPPTQASSLTGKHDPDEHTDPQITPTDQSTQLPPEQRPSSPAPGSENPSPANPPQPPSAVANESASAQARLGEPAAPGAPVEASTSEEHKANAVVAADALANPPGVPANQSELSATATGPVHADELHPAAASPQQKVAEEQKPHALATPDELLAPAAQNPVPVAGRVDNRTSAHDNQALQGHFCRIDLEHNSVAENLKDGTYQGDASYGVFLEPVSVNEDGYPELVLIRLRDSNALVVVGYEALKPADAGGR